MNETRFEITSEWEWTTTWADRTYRWRWKLIASNGIELLTSAAYASRKDCLRSITTIRRIFAATPNPTTPTRKK